MHNESNAFEQAAQRSIDMANELAERQIDADLWEIADGTLSGAIHYWLFSRQPCPDRDCDDCAPVATAELRLQTLLKLVRELAEESLYYHSPSDHNAAHG